MSSEEETRSSLLNSAQQTLGDLVYTVVFDTCNEMISAGLEQSTVLECANLVVKKYVSDGIKMRKKPAPRASKPKAPTSQIDAITAASRKMKKKVSERIMWVYHPSDNEYSYTTDVQLVTGYPVKQNISSKVVGVVDDTSCKGLTMEDARVAISMGLDVDFDSVIKSEKN